MRKLLGKPRSAAQIDEMYKDAKFARIRSRLNAFVGEEDGALYLFGMFTFLMMLVICGVAVDYMRYESVRTKLQNTTDNAVLAAADMSQDLDGAAIVADHFDKAGLSAYLSSNPDHESTANSRKKTAEAELPLDTYFLKLLDTDTLTAIAQATAEETIGDIEISMVLDVSGSMRGSKLTAMQEAANTFLTTVFDDTDEGRLTVSIIPYAEQVSVGAGLLGGYANVTEEHDYSNCVEWAADDYLTTAVPDTMTLTRAGHFDPSNDKYRAADDNPFNYYTCPIEESREIFPLSSNEQGLKDFVNNLEADGWTATDTGIKWGVTLLDPASQQTVENVALPVDPDDIDPDTEYVIATEHIGLPREYSTADVLKVLVVMSDGENTYQHRLKDEYRDGLTEVWYHDSTETYSIYEGIATVYEYETTCTTEWVWTKKKKSWYQKEVTTCEDVVVGQSEAPQWRIGVPNGSYHSEYTDERKFATYIDDNGDLDDPDNIEEESYLLSWPQLFNLFTPEYIDDEDIYGESGMNYPVEYLNGSTMNTRTNNICTAAKDAGIQVYTVGFDITAGGTAETVLENCASSDSHYFDVDEEEIEYAFEAIANNIGLLRLTE